MVHVVLTKALWPIDPVPAERAAIEVNRLLDLIGMRDRELPMSTAPIGLLIVLILLALPVLYVQKIKHDNQKFLSAYLVIVALFPTVAFGLLLLTAVTGAMFGSAIASPVVLAVTLAFALLLRCGAPHWLRESGH